MSLHGNNMFFRIALIMLVACPLLMGSTLAVADVDPASMSELSSGRTVLLAKMKELTASQSRIATLKAERSASDDAVRLAQIKNRESRDNLEKRQKQDREYPGENTDKLREAEEQNKQAANALKSAKENLAIIESNIIAANAMASTQYVTFKRLLQSFESRLKALVETQVQSEVVKLQVTKVVEAKGIVSCGDDGMRLCKEKSRKEARKNATEQGSIIDFSAFTEVKNFQLSKEEILSEVHATLSNEEVLSSKIVDESSALTEIRVTVEPVISLKLRHRIADGIRDDLLAKLGGRIDFSEVNNPSLDAAAGTAQRLKKEPPTGKKMIRVGKVIAVKMQYGYLVIALDAPNAVAGIGEVVIVNNGEQFYGKAEKRVLDNLSATLDEDDLRRIENSDAVFVYQ